MSAGFAASSLSAWISALDRQRYDWPDRQRAAPGHLLPVASDCFGVGY